jgi:hypothetical protein
MAHDPQTLTIEPGPWCAEADRLIGLSVQHATPADIRHQVDNGGARLFHIKHGGAIVGAFVLRVDSLPGGDEGVIVAAAGNLQGVDLTASCMPAIESLFVNCRSIRYHTATPALARKLSRMGYVPREIVCFKEVQK